MLHFVTLLSASSPPVVHSTGRCQVRTDQVQCTFPYIVHVEQGRKGKETFDGLVAVNAGFVVWRVPASLRRL
eukprot:12897149-Prorocentrum_lima.AAC.1